MYIFYQEANKNHKTRFSKLPKDLRITEQLIISYKKPNKAVTISTISRWCKVILRKAGIDIEKNSFHSTRSATTSKTKIKGLSQTEINKAARWTETSTFRRLCDKPIFKTFGDLVIINQTQSRYLIYIMLILGKFSVFSLTTLMLVNSVA